MSAAIWSRFFMVRWWLVLGEGGLVWMFLREWGVSEQAAAGGHGECQETEGGKGGKLFHDVVMLETGRGLAMEKTAEWGVSLW
jgi:hypothetical protein